MEKRELLLQQLNRKMHKISVLDKNSIPASGWIRAIRLALGMSMQQLGKKLSISAQGVKDMESREVAGTVTINTLQEIAKVLDMQLVYGFVPNDGTLDKLIDRKATEIATQIVMRTSNTMKLEAQENSGRRLKKAIKERSENIKKETPKLLWD